MSTTKISLIIPAYNCAGYIAGTLDSVFAQEYPALEIIVVDDGSTDDTPQVLAPYQDRIRYFARENSGPSAARNHGLGLAQGEYLVFLDADDLLLPGKLAEQAHRLDAQPEVGFIHSGWRLIDAQGDLLGVVEPWRQAPELDLETWLWHSPVFMGAMMFRRRWVEQAGGFDPSLHQAEDVKLMLTLARLGCIGAWQRRPTVCYRQHGRSLTRNGSQQAECVTRVLAEFFAQPDLPPYIRCLENEVQYHICLWCVHMLYTTGHHDQIASYLRRSLQYVDSPPAKTVQRWLGHVILRCRAEPQGRIEETRALWPHFKAAIQVSEAQWSQIERVLTLLMHAEKHRIAKLASHDV